MQKLKIQLKIKKLIAGCLLSLIAVFKRLTANRWSLVAYSAARRQEGFTLVEAIIAISVLAVGVVGAITLISAGITNLGVSKDRLVAAGLAQEGVEVVHNIRDTNWLAVRPWNDWNIDGTVDSCSPCAGYVLWNSSKLESAAGIDLRWNGSTNHYDNSGASGESFYRIITITDLGDLSSPLDGTIDYASVKSTVGWGGTGNCAAGGITTNYRYCLTLEERLYDWR